MYNKVIESLRYFDAGFDIHFKEHFVKTVHLKRISNDDSNVVFGTKGTGKTALRRALNEIENDKFFSSSTLDLKTISFNAIYSKIKELNKSIKQEPHVLSRAAWQNILLNYSLASTVENITDIELKNKIIEILKKEKYLNDISSFDSKNSSNKFLLSAFDSIYDYATNVPFTKSKMNIPTDTVDIINRFPINNDLSLIIDNIIEEISKSNKKVLLCIDGLDSIVEHTEFSRQTIFSGLIDAIYQLKDLNISKAFCFKAFLPQELTIEAKKVNWDRDKTLKQTHYINWNKNDLKEFIKKRFLPYSKKGYTKFEDIWAEFFPRKITNLTHGIEEDTFEYILRHTFYRPRQLQDHIYTIMVRWVERTGGYNKIDQSFIPSVISDNNRVLTDVLVDQLTYIFPNILKFLASWKNNPSTTDIKTIRERINTYLAGSSSNSKSIDKIFDYLYIFGVFGISEDKTPIDSWNKFKKFQFSFVDEAVKINTSISYFIDSDAIIGFSPMLKEFCRFKSNGFIVLPSEEELL